MSALGGKQTPGYCFVLNSVRHLADTCLCSRSSLEVQESFTRHRYEMPILAVFMTIAVVELLVVHFLVSLWSATAAWVLSGLTALMLGQIVLLVHGMIRWPTLIDSSGITIRHGRRGKIFVPLAQVVSVEDVAFRFEEKGSQTFRATVLAQPNLAIRLSKPLTYKRRSLLSITMRLDEPASFLEAHRLLRRKVD